MIKKILFVVAILLAFTAKANAQATSASKLVWDQAAASLAEAQGFTYKLYADGSTTANVLTSTTCTGTASPFVCQNNFPAFTPGTHSITLSTSNAAGESAKSAPFTFTFVVVPSVPGNLRLGEIFNDLFVKPFGD